MTPSFERRRGQVLALAILFALAAILRFALIGPVWSAFGDQADAIATSENALMRYRAAIGRRAVTEATLRELQQQGAAVSGILEGASTALAAARLQNDLRSIVEANGGEIRTMSNRPPSTEADFEKVAIECDLTLPMNHLKSLTYQIETHTPYLFVDNADIRMPENWQLQGGVAPRLEIRWVVSGYRWAGSK